VASKKYGHASGKSDTPWATIWWIIELEAVMSFIMAKPTTKDKFYGPLKQVAQQYIPLLMARLKILEQRSMNAMEFLDAESDEDHEYIWEFDETERIALVAEAQTDLHKSILEAGTAQALVGAFIDLLEEDYRKIRDNSCFFVDSRGKHISLYEGQKPDP
tara:strand:- start:146 stop:625 length:480 start_codon:yes stop_codon:yes gene_type:complete